MEQFELKIAETMVQLKIMNLSLESVMYTLYRLNLCGALTLDDVDSKERLIQLELIDKETESRLTTLGLLFYLYILDVGKADKVYTAPPIVYFEIGSVVALFSTCSLSENKIYKITDRLTPSFVELTPLDGSDPVTVSVVDIRHASSDEIVLKRSFRFDDLKK